MSFLDNLITTFDAALKTLDPVKPEGASPADEIEALPLAEDNQTHAAGLMRINHTGEVCAQALYEGQALTAKNESVKEVLLEAASEEEEHLRWCHQRLVELESQPSLLNPFFYVASYAMGAVTGLFGDKVSLGFVHATEDQVCQHLQSHLESLPAEDLRSRAVLKTMYADEMRHGTNALSAGGAEFPRPVRELMRVMSKIMTKSTYRI